jgi:cellulose synthase/poly-beta-1,6-N-acetylglucosamine synthase-like glycosyltransferase
MAPGVIVAVPAHNELARIAECLLAIGRSARAAIAAGSVSRVLIAVAAHRSTDGTQRRARTVLEAMVGPTPPSAITALLVRDHASTTVGQVRARLIATAADRFSMTACDWLFNTDADSIVPTDWISTTTHRADSESAVAVAGMVALSGWDGSAGARRRYRKIIRSGITPDGHRHVYGANLAVRWDAYTQVGGFPSAAHGEDTRLVDALRAAGAPVMSTFTPLVLTSGRVPGRAENGLGSLLGRLERTASCVAAERVL